MQEQLQAVHAAEAQLQSTNEVVTELRAQLAALSTDFKGKLAAKGAEMDELQASNTKLGQQLADMCTSKQQAEVHAGAAWWGWSEACCLLFGVISTCRSWCKYYSRKVLTAAEAEQHPVPKRMQHSTPRP